MAKYDVKGLLEKFTVNGEVDYTKLNEELEKQTQNIVAKETGKQLETLKEENLSSMIKELGIEGKTFDDVKVYIKQVGGSTDKAKEEVIRLTTELNKAKKQYEDEANGRKALEKEKAETHQLEMIKSLGITEPTQIEFFKWKFNQGVTEEKSFDVVVEEYKKANDITTTTKFVKDEFGLGEGGLDIKSAFENSRKFTRK